MVVRSFDEEASLKIVSGRMGSLVLGIQGAVSRDLEYTNLPFAPSALIENASSGGTTLPPCLPDLSFAIMTTPGISSLSMSAFTRSSKPAMISVDLARNCRCSQEKRRHLRKPGATPIRWEVAAAAGALADHYPESQTIYVPFPSWIILISPHTPTEICGHSRDGIFL